MRRSRAGTTSRSSRAAWFPCPGAPRSRTGSATAIRASPRARVRWPRRLGRGGRHQRLRARAASAPVRNARRARRALRVRFVAVRLRRREPTGACRGRAGRAARRSRVRGRHRALRRVEGRLRGRGPRRVRGPRARRAPGLIVGPHDPTDRFAYWVARFVRPHVLGARPVAAVVPAPATRPLQFVDARDLAEWLLDARRGAARRHVQCLQPVRPVDDGLARRCARRSRSRRRASRSRPAGSTTPRLSRTA